MFSVVLGFGTDLEVVLIRTRWYFSAILNVHKKYMVEIHLLSTVTNANFKIVKTRISTLI